MVVNGTCQMMMSGDDMKSGTNFLIAFAVPNTIYAFNPDHETSLIRIPPPSSPLFLSLPPSLSPPLSPSLPPSQPYEHEGDNSSCLESSMTGRRPHTKHGKH